MRVLVTFLAVFSALLRFPGVKSHGVQPLSAIALHRAVIDIDDQAYIRATPLILGVNVRLDYMTTIRLHSFPVYLTKITSKKILIFCQNL